MFAMPGEVSSKQRFSLAKDFGQEYLSISPNNRVLGPLRSFVFGEVFSVRAAKHVKYVCNSKLLMSGEPDFAV